jgi:hypothetical protein
MIAPYAGSQRYNGVGVFVVIQSARTDMNGIGVLAIMFRF